MVDGETRPAAFPSLISTRYLAYSAAWSLVPRATSSTVCGSKRRMAAATVSSSGPASVSSVRHCAGCSAISAAIGCLRSGWWWSQGLQKTLGEPDGACHRVAGDDAHVGDARGG